MTQRVDGIDVDATNKRGPIKDKVRFATSTALPASTYLAGQFTANANGAFPVVDGVTAAVNDRFLDKDHATGARRGWMMIDDLGGAGTKFVYHRTPDADTSDKIIPGVVTEITEGTANGDCLATLTANGTAGVITLDTDALTFALASSTAVGVSNAAPQALGVAAAGTGTSASRDDHVHPTTGLALAATSVVAGAGLTGGGTLASDLTLNVVANADGSIVVNADDVQVGILATDAQHGNRGGGGIHANAVASGAAGFMTGADKALLDELAADAAPTYKLVVRAASQGNLAGTRSGNVFTLTALAVLLKATIDSGWSGGPALAAGDRLLLPSQTDPIDNGIYVITTLGTVGVAGATLTRASDANTSALLVSQMYVPVAEGTDANIAYLLAVANPITINVTGLTFTRDNLSAVVNPVIGTGAGQSNFQGGAKVASAAYAAHSTRTGLITDYYVPITDTSAAVIYQAIAMGAAAGQRIPLIIKDESYSGGTHTQGEPLLFSITLKPLAGKKLNNVVDATLVILNNGGCISVLIDENDNMHQLGFSP